MRKKFIFWGVLVYTLVVGFTVFSISKYCLYNKIIREIECSYVDYDTDDFIEDIASIDLKEDIKENLDPKYGVKEINGQTCFVMEDIEDPKLALVLMIPVFLTMDLTLIENKKPRKISLYI